MRFSKRKEEVLVCTDRKSRLTKLHLAREMKPKEITRLTKLLLNPLQVKTITNDNGLEFRDSSSMDVPVYHCDPGRPDQRGTVENTIGVLRKELPKSVNPSEIDLQAIEDRLNHRPRKCLDFKTPFEAFYETTVALVT
jgi:IS30 family transposase